MLMLMMTMTGWWRIRWLFITSWVYICSFQSKFWWLHSGEIITSDERKCCFLQCCFSIIINIIIIIICYSGVLTSWYNFCNQIGWGRRKGTIKNVVECIGRTDSSWHVNTYEMWIKVGEKNSCLFSFPFTVVYFYFLKNGMNKYNILTDKIISCVLNLEKQTTV